jgi:acyl-CoA thioesterase-1
MSWVICFFGSGAAFFAGVGGVLAGVALFSVRRRDWSVKAATLFSFLGLILVTLSATPLPYWFYATAGVLTLTWLVSERLRRARRHSWLLRRAVVVCCVAALALEIPYHLTPALPPAGRPTLYLFADSVSAGMGESRRETWPELLARSHGVEVQNHSQMGATVRSMLRDAEKLPLGDGLYLLEIGGNDLLGSTTASDYERDLEKLLDLLCRPGRTVVMFELPLPPFANEFGRAQRRLAAKYGVPLIPKRVFTTVLTTDGATLDGVHLTRAGHELMAETVWDIIRPAYAD